MKKLLICLLFVKINIASLAQTKLRVEKFDAYSVNSKSFEFLKIPYVMNSFYAALKKTAKEKMNLTLEDNIVEPVVKIKQLGGIANKNIDATITHKDDFNGWHLFVQLNENNAYYLKEIIAGNTETLLLSANSSAVIEIKMLVKDNTGITQLNNSAYFIIQNKQNSIIGFPNWNYCLSPTALGNLMQQAVNIFLDTTQTVEQINIVHGSPAFFTDNFIMPNIVNHKKTICNSKGEFCSYLAADSSTQIIRYAKPEIFVLDLKKNKTDTKQIAEAKKHRQKNSNYDYCFIEQQYRSVYDNLDFISKIFVAIDKENSYGDENLAIEFLGGNINYLLQEKDTIAHFSIHQNTNFFDKEVYMNKVYNGLDTLLQFPIPSPVTTKKMVYDMDILGFLKQIPFRILCSDNNTIKEIFYNNQLVCIAKGNNTPETFVVIDEQLPKEKLQALLLISFINFP